MQQHGQRQLSPQGAFVYSADNTAEIIPVSCQPSPPTNISNALLKAPGRARTSGVHWQHELLETSQQERHWAISLTWQLRGWRHSDGVSEKARNRPWASCS